MLRNETDVEENIASEQPATTILHRAEKGDDSCHTVFAWAQKSVEKLPIAPNVQSSEKAARTSAAAHSRQLTVVMRRLPTCTAEKSDERFLWTLVS